MLGRLLRIISEATKRPGKVFTFFIKRHQNMKSLFHFCKAPEAWFDASKLKPQAKDQCSLCHFPSFQLITAPLSLASSIVDEIQNEHPAW